MHCRLWTVILLLAMGCASSGRLPDKIIDELPPSPARGMVSRDIVLGRSVKGESISMRVLGAGGPTVFIMGGIHGDERTSVDLTAQLAALLEKHPEHLAGRRVALLCVANPDGYAANQRTNARGIDVNRNFPATNFRNSRRFGAHAASEPETQAIIAAIDQLNPRLIISIHAISRGRECNNYDGPAEQIALVMSRYNRYRVTPTIGYSTPGSMGSYAGIDRKIPMITLELPWTASANDAWETNREALLAAIRETK